MHHNPGHLAFSVALTAAGFSVPRVYVLGIWIALAIGILFSQFAAGEWRKKPAGCLARLPPACSPGNNSWLPSADRAAAARELGSLGDDCWHRGKLPVN